MPVSEIKLKAGWLREALESAQDSLRAKHHPAELRGHGIDREGYIGHAAACRLYDVLAARFKAWTGIDIRFFNREGESTMKAYRSEVYGAIDGERAYQDAGKGNALRHDGMPAMTPGEIILCMEHCLAEARRVWYAPNGGVACLDHIRKVAALGVQAMELHGVPHRDGFSAAGDFARPE